MYVDGDQIQTLMILVLELRHECSTPFILIYNNVIAHRLNNWHKWILMKKLKSYEM